MWVRKALRRRRDAKRRRDDAAAAALLASEEGRSLYWQDLAEKCAVSSMIALLERSLALDGDVIECGVFRGRSLRMICKTIHSLAGRRKTVLGLDTFEGFPEGSVSAVDASLFRPISRLQGKFRDAGDVPGLLADFADIFDIALDIRKGRFEDTLPDVCDRQYCFIHLDCDTYRSHMQCLAALYDRLVPGGVIVFDDYGSKEWPGASAAVDDFLLGKPETVEVCSRRPREAWYMAKTAWTETHRPHSV